MILSTGGHAWPGGMCGWGVHGWGACVAGGHAWEGWRGACMARGHACLGGGACVAGGHAWWGACMVRACVEGGVRGRGHAWQGVCVTRMPPGQILRLGLTVNERAVHMVLECILVYNIFNSACDSVYGKMLSYNNCDIGSYFCYKKKVENAQENYNYNTVKRTYESGFEAHPCMTSLSFGIAVQ